LLSIKFVSTLNERTENQVGEDLEDIEAN